MKYFFWISVFFIFTAKAAFGIAPTVATLVEQEKVQVQGCSAPLLEVEPIEKLIIETPKTHIPIFADKPSALKVMAIMEKYPGRSEATISLMEKLTAPGPATMAERIGTLLRSVPCNEMLYFKIFRQLIANAKHYEFSNEDWGTLRRLILDFVERDLGGAMSSLSFNLRIALSRDLIDEGQLKFPTGLWTKFQSIENRGNELRERVTDAATDWPKKMTADNVAQYSQKRQESIFKMLVFEQTEIKKLENELKIVLRSRL